MREEEEGGRSKDDDVNSSDDGELFAPTTLMREHAASAARFEVFLRTSELPIYDDVRVSGGLQRISMLMGGGGGYICG